MKSIEKKPSGKRRYKTLRDNKKRRSMKKSFHALHYENHPGWQWLHRNINFMGKTIN